MNKVQHNPRAPPKSGTLIVTPAAIKIALIRDFIIENPKVNFMQVKGHQTDRNKLSYYNRMADAIAGDYRKMGLELERTKPSKRKIKKFKKSNMTNFEPFNIKKHSGWEK